jgi:glutathione S-transferase
MALDFYFGSGSQYAWRVWLALEHKGVPYTAHRMHFDKGDLRTPAYLAINPRGRVPAIVDDGFALFESSAIVAYLEDKYPSPPLLPRDIRARAIVRRIAAEVDTDLARPNEALLDATLFTREPAPPETVAAAKEELGKELARFESYVLEGDTFVGDLTVAEIAIYPFLRFLDRIQERQPQHDTSALVGPKLRQLMRRVEALPYYDKTFPPHWRG